MSKYIKNDTGSDKTWVGQTVSAATYYEIQSSEELTWINDSTLLSDIGSGDAIVAKDDSGTLDITDVNDAINYLKDIKTDLQIDAEGRQINRTAYGKKGWTYLAHPIEFETSKKDSVFSEDYNGTDRGNYLLKFYDSSGTELTTQATIDTDCVETRLTIYPDYDYEVISGVVDIHTAVTQNIRMWVVGGVIDSTTSKPWEYPAASGVIHVKEFAGGINFKFIGVDQKIETDGRASKFMRKNETGVPYQANQFQIIFKHPVGVKHDFQLTLEYFRA